MKELIPYGINCCFYCKHFDGSARHGTCDLYKNIDYFIKEPLGISCGLFEFEKNIATKRIEKMEDQFGWECDDDDT